MPLNTSCSLEAYRANVAKLVSEGYEAKQAVAIAVATLRKACGSEHAEKLLRERPELAARSKERLSSPGPAPKAALDYLKSKGLKASKHWDDFYAQEHATAFTVAKVLELDVLSDVKRSLTKALSEGQTFQAWQKRIRSKLSESGWGSYVDPAQRPARLYTIYQTNLRTARAVGQWDRIQRTKRVLPYLEYKLGPSEQHRSEHVALDGTLRPVDDPFWDVYNPPNGYGCKCWTRQVSRVEAEAKGGETPLEEIDTELVEHVHKRTGDVELLPRGVSPGWNVNPGRARGLVLDRALRSAETELAGGVPGPSRQYKNAADMFRQLIAAGDKTDDEIFKAVQAQFGLDDSKRSYVSWYRGDLRRKGVTAPKPKGKVVPPPKPLQPAVELPKKPVVVPSSAKRR